MPFKKLDNLHESFSLEKIGCVSLKSSLAFIFPALPYIIPT